MTLFAARYKNIGLKIAYYRKKRGYTQAELAERIGMSVAYLGQIERGNRGNSFSLETLYQIADALKIDVNLLIKNEMLAWGDSATSNEKLMYIEKLIYTANHKIY